MTPINPPRPKPAGERKAKGRPRVFGLSPKLLKQGPAMRAWVMRNYVVETSESAQNDPGPPASFRT
ncbi:hypothetical protein EP7_005560 (plasmid) [Isosphaeraceae bacterium EP7]